MHARKITLVEIGAGPLPAVTPVVVPRSSWFPMIYNPPAVPSVEGVVPNPVADGVLIEWASVDQEGVIYIIERGPTHEGPWTGIHRTTETRYLYSDGSGQTWWFRITASVRGKPGEGSLVEATPGRAPSYAEMEAINQALGQEILDRLAGDLQAVNDATAGARQYTDAEVSRLNGLLSEIMEAPTWAWETEYPIGFYVKSGGKLYAAKQSPNINMPPHDHPGQWTLIGEFVSVAEALAATISVSTQNASDIAAEAARVDAVVARMPAGSGALATSAQVASEQQARADADTALGQRVDSTDAALGNKASTASVNAVEQASVTRDNALGQRIDTTDAELSNKASSQALQLLRSEVAEIDGEVSANSSAVTQLRAGQMGGGNLATNSSFNGMYGWTAFANTTGLAAQVGSSNGTLPGDPAAYTPGGLSSLLIHLVGAAPVGSYVQVASSDLIAVKTGEFLLASAWINAFRCQAKVCIYYYGNSGAFMGSQSVLQAATSNSLATFNNLPRPSFVLPISSDAVGFVRIGIELVSTGEVNPYLWFIRPQLEKVSAGKTQPSPWNESATGIDAKYAAATQALSVRATQLENGQSQLQASYTWALDVSGRAIGMTSINNGTIGRIDFVADRFGIVDPNNTGSTTFEDGRWITRSGGYMLAHGKPFGTTGDLMMWIGNGSNPATASKSNGLFWLDNKGNAYFGGSLQAGVLRHSSRSTSTAANSETGIGPFVTNGGQKSLVLSYDLTKLDRTSTTFTGAAGSVSAVVDVFRQVGIAAETLVQTLSVTGTFTREGNELAQSMQGSVTWSDTTPAASTVGYRAVLRTRNLVTGTTGGQVTVPLFTQTINIISVEQ